MEGFESENLQRQPNSMPISPLDKSQSLFSDLQPIETNFEEKSFIDLPRNYFNTYFYAPTCVAFTSHANGAIGGINGGGGSGVVYPGMTFSPPIMSPYLQLFISSSNEIFPVDPNQTPNFSMMDSKVAITSSPTKDEYHLAPNKKVGRKRERDSSSSLNLMKGQWSEDEDNKLRLLVNHFGVQNWSQIVENMVGRAGKQCRERWHNHLSPNIKKDSWTQDEERMLVTAHKEIGNRWADIAKRIPCRSENSIKNHWNAAKRRWNIRRRVNTNEVQNEKNAFNIAPQATSLQNYINEIKSKDSAINSTATLSSNSTNISHELVNLPCLEFSDENSPTFLAQDDSNEDELRFMANLFHTQNPAVTEIEPLGNNNIPKFEF